MAQPTDEAPLKESSGQWGRAWYVEGWTFFSCLMIFLFSPLLVLYFYLAAYHYQASLLEPIYQLFTGQATLRGLWEMLPGFSASAAGILGVWLSFQIALALLPDVMHRWVPGYRGGQQLGPMNPSGDRLWYEVNGLQAWVISHIFFLAGAFWFHWFSPTIIFDHWLGLLVSANILGWGLSFLVYAKAYLWPSFAQDRKFSGNFLYDFYMGIELNPRFGPWDLKLFFNGRPGIVAWTLINLSFAFAQYHQYGYVTNSMIILNILQGLYVLYFFWKETWYLSTIDIQHDHFGWMLAWGDCVWLPFMYTLQGLFLVFHPVELSHSYAAFVTTLGLVGFWIFVSSNNQKDRFRRTDGLAPIWNKLPTYVDCEYQTADGVVNRSKLLTSGWWGIARHMNYTGDLLLSLCYSLVCGFGYIFPYFYFLFMIILLVHRCLRDEDRCRRKYGLGWKKYCDQVPFRLIPGLF